MITILSICGAVVALMLVCLALGGGLSSWLGRECDKMRAESMTESRIAAEFQRRGLHFEAEWHRENARILRRNVRACQRVAGWLR